MFLACRSRCGHCNFVLRQGGDAPYYARNPPLPYCTRFLPKYKVRLLTIYCGNQWEMYFQLFRISVKLNYLASRVTTNNHNKRVFLEAIRLVVVMSAVHLWKAR